MSQTFQTPRGSARADEGVLPDLEPDEALSNSAQIERMREPAPQGEGPAGDGVGDFLALWSGLRAGFGAGPGYLNPVVPVPWVQPGTFDDVRQLAEEEAPLKDTPGKVLHSDTSVGSSGYTQTQVNGPGVRQSDGEVHAHGLEAAAHLRTQGSQTTATARLGEMDMVTGDSPSFKAGLGSAKVDYEGQHTRASVLAHGPSVGMAYSNKDGPSMKMETGSASAEGTATVSGSRWSASAGGRGEVSGPSAGLNLKDGLKMSPPSVSVEGGVGVSRQRYAGDPDSSEQVVAVTREAGSLPSLTVNGDALVHIAQDNPEAVAAARRGLATALLDEQNTGLGEDFDRRTSPQVEVSATDAPTTTSETGGGGGGFWSSVASWFSGSGSGSSGGAVQSSPRTDTSSDSTSSSSDSSASSDTSSVWESSPSSSDSSPSSASPAEESRREEPAEAAPAGSEAEAAYEVFRVLSDF